MKDHSTYSPKSMTVASLSDDFASYPNHLFRESRYILPLYVNLAYSTNPAKWANLFKKNIVMDTGLIK